MPTKLLRTVQHYAIISLTRGRHLTYLPTGKYPFFGLRRESWQTHLLHQGYFDHGAYFKGDED